jgi:hypothetical protein
LVPLLGILLPIPGPVRLAFNGLGCLSCDKPAAVGGFNPDLLAGENTGICEMGILEVANFGGLTLSAVGAGAEVDVRAGEMDDNGSLKIDDFVPLMIGKGKDEGFTVEIIRRCQRSVVLGRRGAEHQPTNRTKESWVDSGLSEASILLHPLHVRVLL